MKNDVHVICSIVVESTDLGLLTKITTPGSEGVFHSKNLDELSEAISTGIRDGFRNSIKFLENHLK